MSATKNVTVDVQVALNDELEIDFPVDEKIQQWVVTAINMATIFRDNVRRKGEHHSAHITVRIVDEREICQLNETFRHKVGATNVLSFPFQPPPGVPIEETEAELGDIAVCASVISKEASEQAKAIDAHWAHMIVHGTLHLMGYDHQNDKETSEMESLEKKILSELSFPNPYTESE